MVPELDLPVFRDAWILDVVGCYTVLSDMCVLQLLQDKESGDLFYKMIEYLEDGMPSYMWPYATAPEVVKALQARCHAAGSHIYLSDVETRTYLLVGPHLSRDTSSLRSILTLDASIVAETVYTLDDHIEASALDLAWYNNLLGGSPSEV